MKLLLADDHDLVRDSLVTLITAYAPGTEVTAVSSLDAALGMLKRGNRYDIAILDLQMPGDSADVQPRRATKGEEGKFAWINATLHGQQADALGHSG